MREIPVCQAEKANAVARTAEKPTTAHAPVPMFPQSRLVNNGMDISTFSGDPKRIS